jgi:ribosomal protein L11
MMGSGDMAGQAAAAQLANKLGASGVESSGVIEAMRATGETDMGGGHATEVDVTITPPGGPAYETTIKQSFLPAQLEGLAPGSAITVKYDPDNPAAALIYSW